MRRIIAIAGALALTASFAVPAVATPEPIDDGFGHKDVVCHATSAEGKWVKIVVDTASAQSAKTEKAHFKHTISDAPGTKRHDQLDTIYRGLSEEDAETLVCGDFNTN